MAAERPPVPGFGVASDPMPLVAILTIAVAAGLLGGFGVLIFLPVGGVLVALMLAWRHGPIAAVAVAAACVGAFWCAASSPASDVRVTSPTPGVLEPARLRTARSIDTLFGSDAPLARALLVADEHEIPADERARYADAGLIHMLSISGLHVAILAGAMQLLWQVIGLSRRAAAGATAIVIGGYVALLGAPAPALRSAVMLMVSLASALLQRPTSPWATLAIGALVPLWSPRTILDLGYQLSVLGMVGVLTSGMLVARWRRRAPRRSPSLRWVRWARLFDARRRWPSALARELVGSLVASLITAPLIAWTFGRLSLVGPVANLVAAPLLTLVQPAMFLALLLAPCPPLARFVVGATHPLLAAFTWVAASAASLPLAALTVAPGLPTAICCAVAVCGGIIACAAVAPARWVVVGVGALVVAVWLPLAPAMDTGRLELHMIDVGQGDAIALRTPRGRWVLFDAGRSWPGGDAGHSIVVPYLRRRGGDLEAFVLSHPHADHIGGAASVVRALRPKSYWEPAFVVPNAIYATSLDAVRATGVTWHRIHPGDSLVVDRVRIDFLAPDSAWMATLSDPNLASTIARVRFGDVTVLLVGDAERAEEEWLLAHDSADLAADVLKVGHHGSVTSSTARFLDAVHPRIALVSVGAANGYGHPSSVVLAALDERGATVLRTDQRGSVVLVTDGHHIFPAAGARP